MPFQNYNDFPPPQPVEIPIGEKTYLFPSTISARAWVLAQRLTVFLGRIELAQATGKRPDETEDIFSDLEYADIRSEVFGETERELMADGVSSDCMQRLFVTLVAYHTSGREAAETVWNLGEAPAPNRAARRKTTSTQSRGSHAGSTSRQPGASPGAKPSTTGASSKPTSKSATA